MERTTNRTTSRSAKRSTERSSDRPTRPGTDSNAKRSTDDNDAATAANRTAVDLTRPERSTRPHMPHERDEQTGSTGGIPSETVQQGYEDVSRGLQDTSRANETDRAYQAQKQVARSPGKRRS